MRPHRVGMFVAVLSSFAVLAWAHGDKHKDSRTETANGKIEKKKEKILARRKMLGEIGIEYNSSVKPIFKTKCFDCHSNQTEYPWYYKLPKVKTLIDKDVAEGKKHLDLTDGFPFRGHGTPEEDLMAIREAIDTGTMPPFRYRWLHWGSKISKAEKKTIFSWIDHSLNKLQSLVKKDRDERK